MGLLKLHLLKHTYTFHTKIMEMLIKYVYEITPTIFLQIQTYLILIKTTEKSCNS